MGAFQNFVLSGSCTGNPLWLPLLGQAQGTAPTVVDFSVVNDGWGVAQIAICVTGAVAWRKSAMADHYGRGNNEP